MFASDFGILTYSAVCEGKCLGQDLWPIWGTAFHVRDGGTRLWSSGINVLTAAGAG